MISSNNLVPHYYSSVFTASLLFCIFYMLIITPGNLFNFRAGNVASTSISTKISGLINRLTSTNLLMEGKTVSHYYTNYFVSLWGLICFHRVTWSYDSLSHVESILYPAITIIFLGWILRIKI